VGFALNICGLDKHEQPTASEYTGLAQYESQVD